MPDVTDPGSPGVHQIWFSDGPDPETLPANSRALRSMVGPERFHLWTIGRTRQLIVDNFAAEVTRAFDRLRPYAYKADLARYCIVMHHGGYYLDLAVSGVVLTETRDWDFIGFRDLNSDATSWKVANNYFFARQGSILMADCLEQILENCSREYYGKDPHFPTGPSVLGRAVAKLGPDLRILVGEYMWFAHRRNKYLMPHKRIVGRGKVGGRANGGVSNVPGGNNYNDLWHARTVYGPEGDALPGRG